MVKKSLWRGNDTNFSSHILFKQNVSFISTKLVGYQLIGVGKHYFADETHIGKSQRPNSQIKQQRKCMPNDNEHTDMFEVPTVTSCSVYTTGSDTNINLWLAS